MTITTIEDKSSQTTKLTVRNKAAILVKQNAPLVVDYVETLSLDYGQVLVRVHASGVCGAQLGEIFGNSGEDKYLPHLLGHEGGGIVMAVGPGVIKLIPGNHVAIHWRKGTGMESLPPKYIWNNDTHGGLIIGGGWNTTFNEYGVISENRLTVVDNDIPFEVAALMGCAVTTGLGIVNNEAQLKIGQSIAVAGCGGVGLSVIQGAAMVSANPIIAVDRISKKRNIVMALGATHFFVASRANGNGWARKAAGTVNNKGIDVFVDCTGSPEVIDVGLQLIASGGRMILVGQPKHGSDLVIHSVRQHYKGKTIIDSQGGLSNPTIDIPRYCRLYKQGILDLDTMITNRFPLENVNEAIRLLKTEKILGRIILEMP